MTMNYTPAKNHPDRFIIFHHLKITLISKATVKNGGEE